MNIEDFKGASEIDIYLAYTLRAEEPMSIEELKSAYEEARDKYRAAINAYQEAEDEYDLKRVAYQAARDIIRGNK
jgi:hypothetical protein